MLPSKLYLLMQDDSMWPLKLCRSQRKILSGLRLQKKVAWSALESTLDHEVGRHEFLRARCQASIWNNISRLCSLSSR